MSIFKLAPIPRELDLAQSMGWVKRTYGTRHWGQAAHLARLMLGAARLEPQDYYKLALFRPEKAQIAAKEYLGNKAGRRLNADLSPSATGQSALLANKLLTGLVLNGSGFSTPRTLAFYAATGPMPGLPGLSSAADLTQYLRNVELPVFGKPMDGSLAIGANSYMARTDGGLIRLGDGREFAPETIAADIEAHFPRGYLFQALVRQHPRVEALTGLAVGTLRVVTLWGQAGPRALYCVHKLPAKGAMVDAHARSAHALAHVDPATGRILRAQNMDQMCIKPTLEAPATGASLADVTLPMVPQAVAMCEAAHRLFPTHGLFGFDVMLSEDGPLIGEVNTMPFHMLYQRAADRGLLNPDFAPLLAEAQAATAARIALRARSVTRGADPKVRR